MICSGSQDLTSTPNNDVGSSVLGTSTNGMAFTSTCVDTPVRRRRGDGGVAFSALPELKIEVEGVNGYAYSVKYQNGRVMLSVGSCGDSEYVERVCGSLSVKDWKLFRSGVCSDLDRCGFPEMVYVSQWLSSVGPEMYRVEADRFNRQADDFIFLSFCEDRDRAIVSRGREEWRTQPYPLTLEEYDSWFKTFFFIQWCDWRTLQRVFSEVDEAIKRDRIGRSYEHIRKRLFFGDKTPGEPLGRLTTVCRPKILRHPDF